MKKSYLIAVLISVVAVLWVLSGVFSTSEIQEPVVQTSASKEKEIVSVRVRDLKAEPITTDITVTGKSFASREVELQAEIEGRVTEVVAGKGVAVNEGDVIARLEERDREARLAETQQRAKQREIEYNAARELETKGFNSKVRLSQARADLEAARAELKRAQVELENTRIVAPFGGIIYEQFTETGAYVSPGTPLFSMVDLDPVEIRGFVTEQQVGNITTGSKAAAIFLSGTPVEGEVTYVAPAADPATRTFTIEVTVPNPDLRISQGMTAQIVVPTAENWLHKISPSVLSLDDQGHVGVKIVTDDNKVKFTPVRIVEDYPDYMIVAGLPSQARLITVGQEFVVDGQLVDPQPATGDGLL